MPSYARPPERLGTHANSAAEVDRAPEAEADRGHDDGEQEPGRGAGTDVVTPEAQREHDAELHEGAQGEV